MKYWILLASVMVALGQEKRGLRMTDIQVIGTHNSYHVGISPNELEYLKKVSAPTAAALGYKHPPIEAQLEAGVRQFELDVFGDVKGGLFANPAAPGNLVKAGLTPDAPFDPEGRMKKPGFKVLHVQDIDYRSSCMFLVDCLTIVRNWSKAHPKHLPIYIMLENKDGRPREGMTTPEEITTATMEGLDAEILSVFDRKELITPDDVRGGMKTLEEAVLTKGWPELEKARGKVVFLLDQERVTKFYTVGHPSLEGRVMFTNGEPGTPDAAFVKANNPSGEAGERIKELVRKGYLVRTMLDAGAAGVKAGVVTKRDAGMASGAQLLSTDYPFGWKAEGAGYHVEFEKGNARCNVVVRVEGCSLAKLKE